MQMKQPAWQSMPVLDVRALSPRQLGAFVKCYDSLAAQDLKPLAQLKTDPVRAQIDRAISTILKLPDLTLGGHLKSGQSGSLQNRPVERIQDSYIFTSSVIGLASFFPSESSSAQQLGLY